MDIRTGFDLLLSAPARPQDDTLHTSVGNFRELADEASHQ
jgi:hypothetical protein